MGGGEMYLPLEIVWRTSLGPAFQRVMWADSLHWGCFSKVKMKVLKPSEDKSWVCAEIVVQNCGTTVPKIPWFFFVQTKLHGSFGEADTFLGTCQLDTILCNLVFFWRLAWESCKRKHNSRSMSFCCSCECITLCVPYSCGYMTAFFMFFGSSFCWNCLSMSEKIFWGQKTWG